MSDASEPSLELLDFTAQTPWERFAAAVAATLRAWGGAACGEERCSDPISAPAPPLLSPAPPLALLWLPPPNRHLQQQQQQLRSADAAGCRSFFPARTVRVDDSACAFVRSAAALWFGCCGEESTAVAALVPASAAAEGSLDATAANLLLSSLCAAAAEAPSLRLQGVPLLVQYGSRERPAFVGYALPSGAHPSWRYAAEAVSGAAAERLRYFDGLFPIALGRFRAVAPIATRAAVRFSYDASDWALTASDWRGGGGAVQSASGCCVLLWGPQEDPITAVRLSLEWCHKLPLEDSPEFSEYDMGTASRWLLSCSFSRTERCFLSRSMRVMFLSLLDALPFRSMSQIISTAKSVAQGQQTVLSFSSLNIAGIPGQREIAEVLDCVFDVAHNCEHSEVPECVASGVAEELKSAPPFSLLETLALALLCVRGLSGYLVVWAEFVRRVRALIENEQLLPGVPSSICMRHCLLQQKLAMLNFALSFQKTVGRPASSASMSEAQSLSSSPASRFDYTPSADDAMAASAWEDAVDEVMAHPDSPGIITADEKNDTLLLSGEPLSIPELQNVGTKTEDAVSELQDILMQLGTGPEASALRAKLQSPQVLSDMQAFKAANPGAQIEDFIRWYSPADWIGDRATGHLSVRMASADNAWKLLWEEARPIPARSQPPLFDREKEIAKALHYLETIPPADLLRQMISVSLGGIVRAFSMPSPPGWNAQPPIFFAEQSDVVVRAVQSLLKAIRTSWLGCRPEADTAAKEYENVWTAVSSIEVAVARATSVESKLPGCFRVAAEISGEGCCHLDTFEERMAAVALISGTDELPPPNEKEYIAEASNEGEGRVGACRIYARVSQSDSSVNGDDAAVLIASASSGEYE